MKITRLILVLISIHMTSANAGLLLGGHWGQIEDNGDGFEKLKGPTYGIKTGWRWNWLALEIIRSNYDLDTGRGQGEGFYVEKAQLEGHSTDLVLRFYPLRFLSIAAGVSALELDQDIRLTNVNGNPSSFVNASGDSSYDAGSLLALGLHLPIGGGFELYGEYVRKKWSSMVGLYDLPDLALNEWHVGLVWEWGGGRRKRDQGSR